MLSLLAATTTLTHLNVSSLSVAKKSLHLALAQTICEGSRLAETLQTLVWHEDIEADTTGRAVLNLMLEKMQGLQTVELTQPIHSKSERATFRDSFKAKGVKALLSRLDVDQDGLEDSDSEGE